jgi:hypothetical protein
MKTVLEEIFLKNCLLINTPSSEARRPDPFLV